MANDDAKDNYDREMQQVEHLLSSAMTWLAIWCPHGMDSARVSDYYEAAALRARIERAREALAGKAGDATEVALGKLQTMLQEVPRIDAATIAENAIGLFLEDMERGHWVVREPPYDILRLGQLPGALVRAARASAVAEIVQGVEADTPDAPGLVEFVRSNAEQGGSLTPEDVEAATSGAECRRLRGPFQIGPTCTCAPETCALDVPEHLEPTPENTGVRSLREQAHSMGEALAALWHAGARTGSLPSAKLHEYMGLTWEEYQGFVQLSGPWSDKPVPGGAGSWRTGRKVGRTIYRQVGMQPTDDDPLIGVMDTRELAQHAVDSRNEHQRDLDFFADNADDYFRMLNELRAAATEYRRMVESRPAANEAEHEEREASMEEATAALDKALTWKPTADDMGLLGIAHAGLLRALDFRAATPEALAIKLDVRVALRRSGFTGPMGEQGDGAGRSGMVEDSHRPAGPMMWRDGT